MYYIFYHGNLKSDKGKTPCHRKKIDNYNKRFLIVSKLEDDISPKGENNLVFESVSRTEFNLPVTSGFCFHFWPCNSIKSLDKKLIHAKIEGKGGVNVVWVRSKWSHAYWVKPTISPNIFSSTCSPLCYSLFPPHHPLETSNPWKQATYIMNLSRQVTSLTSYVSGDLSTAR